MPYPCFLVEARNHRKVHVPCTDPECDCGGHDEELFDVVRVDNDKTLAEAVYAFYEAGPKALSTGAMWYVQMEESNRPSDPQDWGHLSEDEKEKIKIRASETPHIYRWGVDEETGMPNRAPSFTFTDGPHLCVMTPGGRWNIDSRASNCGLPYDLEHRCWVRHGEPPNVTVDKNGLTCTAGGGSIQAGPYHGFLRDGSLTDG